MTDGGLASWTLPGTAAAVVRATPRPVPRAEIGFAWLGLMVASGGVLPLVQAMLGVQQQREDLGGGDQFVQTIWLTIYVIAALLLFLRLPRVIRVVPALGTIWVVLAIAIASPLWSASPPDSMRRSMAFVGTTVFAAYLGTRFSRDQFLRILFGVYAVVAPVSLLAGTTHFGVPAGVFQGSFSSKNLLGQAMVLSTVVSLLYALSSAGWKRLVGVGTMVLSCGLLLLSDSKTSAVVLFAALLLLIPLRVLRLRSRVAELAVTVTVVGAGTLAVWIAGNSAAVLNLLGRDATLTGRVQLWEMLVTMIQQRPWLGYGYGGFWLYWNGPSAVIWQVCITRYGWLPPNGHNGFIDLWIDLGLVGLAAFLVYFAVTLVRAMRAARHAHSFLDLFPIVFLYFMVLANLTESNLVTHNSLMWVLFIALSLQLWPQWRRAPRPEDSGADPA